MKVQAHRAMILNLGRALWIGIKVAIVIQLGMETTAVVYQGF